ncbi:6897_t:CDS:2, partial [Entrophospora sp. SA101]
HQQHLQLTGPTSFNHVITAEKLAVTRAKRREKASLSIDPVIGEEEAIRLAEEFLIPKIKIGIQIIQPTDNPETYENRIRPGVSKVVQPADIDAFFTNLKNMWVERRPSLFNYGSVNNMNGMAFQPPQQILQQPVFQPPQQIIQQP